MEKLIIGMITTYSGRWPKELPSNRNTEYGDWLTKQFPNAQIVLLDMPVTSSEDLQNAVNIMHAKKVNLLVQLIGAFTGDNIAAHMAEELNVPIILWAPHEPPFDGGRLMSNALVSATMNAAALSRLEKPYHFIYGGKGDNRAVNELVRLVRVYGAIKKLKNTFLGLLGYRPTAFYSSTFDETLIRRLFGIKIEESDLKPLFDKMEKVPQSLVDKDMATLTMPKNLPDGYAENHSRLYIAMKQLVSEFGFNALAIKCWPEMGNLKATPCAVLSRFADEGYIIGCESDIDATITMLIQNYLTNDFVFMSDLINIDEEENTVTLWHCGQAACKLKAPEAPISMNNHPLAGQGTAFYTTLKSGSVTIARMSKIGDTYKLFLTTGKAVPTVANTTGVMVNVKLNAPVREVIYKIAEEGIPHHYSIVWQDVADDMKKLCEILNIEVIEV
ncbi:MAG: fucose isomerase [Firmicutes bacterium]|nr:fucose isomerase [Bacillota bacterium]